MPVSLAKYIGRSLLLVMIAAVCAALPASAQSAPAVTLKSADLRNGKFVSLDGAAWKYHAGDRQEWAAPSFADNDWQTVTNNEINSNAAQTLAGWQGRAWFRLPIAVEDSLVNQPLALHIWHWGATEIYLDGRLIANYGRIEADGDTEFNPRGLFTPVVFSDGGTHIIAVRQSFEAAADLNSGRGRRLAEAL